MSEPAVDERSGLTEWDLRRLRLQGDAEAVRQLTNALDHPELGLEAAHLLSYIRTPEAEAAVIAGLLGHADPEIRAVCTHALGERESPDVFLLLIGALADPDPLVAEAACSELGFREDAAAIDPLRRALQHPVWKVRLAAVGALLELRVADHEVTAAFERLAAEPDTELVEYGRAQSEKLDRLRDQWAEYYGTANAAGNLAARLAQALNELSDPDETVRRNGVRRLDSIPGAQVLALLRAALKDPSDSVRGAAIMILGFDHREDAALDLIDHLQHDPDHYLRACCITFLIELQDPRTFEPLIQALRSPDSRLRATATTALGRLGDPRATPPLLQVLDDPGWKVRCGAAWALLDLQASDERLVSALKQLAQEPEAEAWDVVASESQHRLEALNGCTLEPGESESRAQPTVQEMLEHARRLLQNANVPTGDVAAS
jgi:HEAT repeat protein